MRHYSERAMIAKQGRIDPFAQRVLGESEGDVNKAVAKLLALCWTETEARAELALCLRTSVRESGRETKRAGASHG